MAVTDRAVELLCRTPHHVAYFHCPVALSGKLDQPGRLAPLSDLYPVLGEHSRELYQGLVHFNDPKGTNNSENSRGHEVGT